VTASFRPRCLVATVDADGVTHFAREHEPVAAAPPYGGLELFRAWSGASLDEVPVAAGDAVTVTLVRFLAPRGDAAPPFTRYHWHDTVDIQILIDGELVQRLDDGSEVTMRPGDVVVQCGGSHAWDVRGGRDAILAIVAQRARRRGPSPPAEQQFDRVFAAARA
jgi:hypothetical protein